MKAPSFSLKDHTGNFVTNNDFPRKYIILYFYPKDNTPGCTIEAIDFTNHQEEFSKFNAVILGVSPDSKESHCKFREKKNLTIILLSDPEKTTIKAYDCWKPKKFMGKEFLGVIRSTFLISPKGEIIKEWRNVNVKNHVIEVLETLKNMQ